MNTPTFSIVIPTRNRAGLLRHALATATAIDAPDVEIVVSDNCSVDSTAEVARSFIDDRVRIVRSEVPLNNADSWEFAVSHAAGEWITVLGDDDGLVPSLVERIRPVADAGETDLVAWSTAYYVHPDTDPPWPVEAERNRLSIHPFRSDVIEIDAQDQLTRFFERREIEPIPGVRDCFVRRFRLDRVREGAGGLFGVPDPNWSLGAALLTCLPSYPVLDLPLSVTGCSTVHIGGGFQRNTRGHDLVREFDDDTLFANVPLRSKTCVNLVAESLERTKERIPELAGFERDPVRYFVANYEELTSARRVADGGAALHEWRAALRSQPRSVRARVRRELSRHNLATSARRIARPFRAVRPNGFRLVDGREAGFDDLAGAAAFLDQLLPPVPAAFTATTLGSRP